MKYTILNISSFIAFLACLFLLPGLCTAAGDFPITVSSSRISGVAPLSVFFDVTSTASFSDGSYVDSTCAWNFDTTGVDNDAKHRTGSGFIAAHVFENPGVYTVKVDIYLATGQHAWEEITITVSPFSGNTYYVASNGSDSNSGTTMNSPFATIRHALTGPHMVPNTRVLFRNGDTFYTSDCIYVNGNSGPVIVGRYSDPSKPSQSKPILYSTSIDDAYGVIHLSEGSDWRIMDLAVRAGGAYSTNPRYPAGITMSNLTTHILKYRMKEYQLGGLSLSPYGQYNTIADCVFHDITDTGYTSNTMGPNDGNALIGNWVYDKNVVDMSNEEHIFRLQGGSRYYIAHNTLGPNVRVNHDTLTIRGNTDRVVIYDNIIYDYVTAIWPQNRNSAEEYQHHCVIDSNLFIGRDVNSVAIGLRAKDIVIRNNIIYNYQIGIGMGNDTVVGPTQRIKIYNNTMINPNANSGFFNLAYVDDGCFDIEFYNNVLLDLAGTTSHYTSLFDLRDSSTLNGSSDYNVLFGVGWDESSGLFDNQSLASWQDASGNDRNSAITDPLVGNIYINLSSKPIFCKPASNSPLINTGKFTGGALDFHGNLRDQQRDIGAVEYVNSTYTYKRLFVVPTPNSLIYLLKTLK